MGTAVINTRLKYSEVWLANHHQGAVRNTESQASLALLNLHFNENLWVIQMHSKVCTSQSHYNTEWILNVNYSSFYGKQPVRLWLKYIYILFGQSILPLGTLSDRNVRSLCVCKELVFSNIAHSGNKEKTKEMREGRKRPEPAKKCPLSEGRVRKMMVHPCYYLVIKKNSISIAEKSKKRAWNNT